MSLDRGPQRRPPDLTSPDTGFILKRRFPGLPLTLYYAPRGPVVDWQLPAPELTAVLRAFAGGVARLGRADRAVLLKCDPALGAGNATGLGALREVGFRVASAGLSFEAVQPRFVYAIDITPGEEDLLASFSPKHRYNIRLAQKKGVRVRTGATEDLGRLYQMYAETSIRDGFVIRSEAYYRSLWSTFMQAGMARALEVKAVQSISGRLQRAAILQCV